ncbi:Phage tail assembly protein I [Escherichia coli IS25]|nr:Phage tail assembly protein I [Escherichia coli IS25]
MKTGAEAIRALVTQLPAFRQKLNEAGIRCALPGVMQAKTNYQPVLMSR